MRKPLILAATALALVTVPAQAQSTTSSPNIGDTLGNLLGNLLGIGNRADNSLDGQWTANRRPLGGQRAAFEARVAGDVQKGLLSSSVASQLNWDYYNLTQLEASYGADGTFTASERSELTTKYNTLLKVLETRRYDTTASAPVAALADGQAEFDSRVDAQLSKRKISRKSATRLKADYRALVALETDYLKDGVLSTTERSDLDARADALDVRVGDVGYDAPVVVVTPQTRLEAIATALPKAYLGTSARAQLKVEHGDLVRLAEAYTRLTPTSEEKAYLDQRLLDLEKRVGLVR